MKLHELLADLSLDGLTDVEALELATDLIKIDVIKERLGNELDEIRLNRVIDETKNNSEHQKAYANVLSSLSNRQRQCYLMKDVRLMTYQAVSEELKIEITTVQTHLEIAREKIEKAKQLI